MTDRVTDLADVLALLERVGVPCLMSGAWAEELLGLRPPGPHSDIDLVHLASSFAVVDRALERDQLPDEIRAKRLPHKRAFRWRAFAVSPADPGWRHPGRLPGSGATCRCTGERRSLTRADDRGRARLRSGLGRNLRWYRARHRDSQPWRWRSFSTTG